MRRSMFLVPLFLIAATAFAADETCPPTWNYQQPWTGECLTGTAQSPIVNNANQRTPNPALTQPVISYLGLTAPVTVKNTGHEIKVVPMFDGTLTVNGKTARLVQFHFHVPAEHKLDVWADAAAELHLVHETATGEVIVIAVPIIQVDNSSNPALAALRMFGTLKACESKASVRPNQLVPMGALLPAVTGRYMTYVGSLTTPPCSPNVTFVLMNDGIRATAPEIAYLKLALGNARGTKTNANPVTYRVASPHDVP
jgi:carbonic anhydrase